MKQTKYNYHGTPQGSHMSYRAEIERLKNTLTVKIIKMPTEQFIE